MMNLDILMFVAFGIFILLLFWRMKERLKGNSEMQELGMNKTTFNWTKFRKCWMIVQLFVLFVLLFYMVPLLWQDFQMLNEHNWMKVALRCLIFIFTIYILFVKIWELLKKRKTKMK